MQPMVLLTGISGFIAKHIALRLLKDGYAVRGTVRDPGRGDAVRETLRQAGADLAHLELAEADLERDAGWAAAADGAEFVLHTASPLPLEGPRGRLDLVPAARGGTLRVLNAVEQAGLRARRVVVTSSIAAMMYRPGRPRRFTVTEHDWTDTEWRGASPYVLSKTLAERAAWQWAREHSFEQRLATVNPSFVIGPPLDRKAAASLDVIRRIFAGAYPAIPPMYFPCVDVRDIADLHVAALTADGVGGRRLLGSAETLPLVDVARILKGAFPERGRRIPTRTIPAPALRVLALFKPSLRTVLPSLHRRPQIENDYVRELTGIAFRPVRESLIDAGRSLIDLGVI